MKPFKRRKTTKKPRTFTKVERFAFWQRYKGICVHCEQPLKFADLHLDHIIPISLTKDPKAFANLLARYELQPDFDVNDYYNFFPCHPSCNRRKSDMLLPVSVMSDFLQRAKKNAAAVHKIVDKKKKERWRVEILVMAEHALQLDAVTKSEASYLRQVIRCMKECQRRIASVCCIVIQTTKLRNQPINLVLQLRPWNRERGERHSIGVDKLSSLSKPE